MNAIRGFGGLLGEPAVPKEGAYVCGAREQSSRNGSVQFCGSLVYCISLTAGQRQGIGVSATKE